MCLTRKVEAEAMSSPQVNTKKVDTHRQVPVALTYLYIHFTGFQDRDCSIVYLICSVGNTGSFNAGNVNLGNFNQASANNGNFNKGDANAGSYNTGSQNNGNSNSGNQNDGTGNAGNQNTVRVPTLP